MSQFDFRELLPGLAENLLHRICTVAGDQDAWNQPGTVVAHGDARSPD